MTQAVLRSGQRYKCSTFGWFMLYLTKILTIWKNILLYQKASPASYFNGSSVAHRYAFLLMTFEAMWLF